MKRVFITGIAGLLGSNIAFNLRDKYEVFGIDKNDVNMKNICCETGSALDTLKVEELIVRYKIDTFIHCAALVNVDLCEENPHYAEIINVKMTENLCILCKKYDIKFVFISSDAVYEGIDVILNKETDPVLPVNVYAQTKLIAEKRALENSCALIIRTNMYGFNFREKYSFTEWVVKSLSANETLNMFYDVYCSPILVNNLVKILELAINKDLKGIYNIGSKNRIDKYSLGVAIKKVFNMSSIINSTSVEDYNFSAKRTKNMGLDCSKIEKDLGITINTVEEDLLQYKKLFDDKYPERLKLG